MNERSSLRPASGWRTFVDWRVLLGFGVTVFLLWWVLRGVDFGEVLRRIREADYLLLTLAVTISTAGFLVRAMRWDVLLRPIRVGTALRSRFASVSVGFMANNLLPLRIGEFARAYALGRMEPVSISGAFGSLVVERFLDAFTILLLLLVSVAAPAFPDAAMVGGRPVGSVINAMAVMVGIVLVGLIVLVLWPKRLVRIFEAVATRILPPDSRRRIVDSLEAFLEGITSLRSPRLLFLALLWSVGFWCWHTLGFWVGFRAFGIEASFMAALFMNAIVAFAVAVPSSPGFFGTFHAGVTLALVGVYGVAEGPALAYAFGFHLAAFIPITIIGLYYVWRLGLSIAEIEGSEEEVEAAVEREHPLPEAGA